MSASALVEVRAHPSGNVHTARLANWIKWDAIACQADYHALRVICGRKIGVATRQFPAQASRCPRCVEFLRDGTDWTDAP